MLRTGLIRLGLAAVGGLALALSMASESRGADEDALEALKARLEKLEIQNQDLKAKLDRIETGGPIDLDALNISAEGGEAAPADEETKKVQKIVGDYLKAAEKNKKTADEAAKKKVADEGYKVGSDLKMNTRWDGYGIRFETPNKDFTYHVGARINYDTVSWHIADSLQDRAPNGGTGSFTTLGGTAPYTDGSFFRRLRTNFDGTFWEIGEFNMEFQLEQFVNNANGGTTFPNGNVGLDEMWVGVKEIPWLGTIRVGHVKGQQGLESLSSSKVIQFMERSSCFDAFWAEFIDGIWFTNTMLDERMTWHAQFGRFDQNDNDGALFGDGQYCYIARLTGLPIYQNEGRCLLHLGSSFGWYTNNNSATRTNQFRYRARLDQRDSIGNANQGNPNRWLDTNAFLADNSFNWSSEFLFINGPFSLQAEYNYTCVNDPLQQTVGSAAASPFLARPDAFFQGYYVTASYFLTGENRNYDRRLGRLASRYITKPHSPFYIVKGECGPLAAWGAWEVLAGIDHLDLDSANYWQAGQMDQYRVGINWYLNPNLSIKFQYINANRYHIGGVGTSGGGVTGFQAGDGSAFGIRTVLEF